MEPQTSRREHDQIEFERARVPVHYEHEEQIFKWVLGQRMAYSTGIWSSADDTLDTAQERKCRTIAARLALGPGSRALDVGCGWGSVLLYLAEHTPAQLHGVTLAARQRDELLHRAHNLGVEDRVRVDLCHVEDLALKSENLDAVYFVGSIVHMHRREDIIRDMARALKPGGRLFISDCYYPEKIRGDRNSRATHYILHEVLGYCLLRTLNEELGVLERNGLDILHVDNLTDSYVRTLEAWIGNVRAHRTRIDALAPGFAATLQAYMRVAQRSFRQRTAIEYMILAEKAGCQHLDRGCWAVG
jgi:cyclopropane-fatty-acyl-phospholipid synthase